MKKILFGTFVILLAACSAPDKIKQNKEYELADGVKVTWLERAKDGLPVDSGDKVEVHYLGQLEDGTEFGSSFGSTPLNFRVGTGKVIKGWELAMQELNEGDSAHFYITADMAYGEKERGKIPANANLNFTVKVLKVVKDPKPYDVSGFDTLDLGDGLKYIRIKKGKGISVQKDHKVQVHYTGYFSDGSLFDSSLGTDEMEPFEFVVGRNFVIQGWDKGLIGMQRGEKCRLIVPYQLAYKEKGMPPVIPPKSDLTFDIQMMDVIVMPKPVPYITTGKDTLQTVTGLKYIKVKKNDSKPISPSDTVWIDFTGYFMNGDIFDSSIERGDSLMVLIDQQTVVPGLNEALKFMREGEKMRVIIPYYLGYGEKGMPPIIPEKSDLIFDIHVRRVLK